MPTTYSLSGRQAKELFSRAAPVRLALPTPPALNSDPLVWASSVLEPELRRLLRTAKRQTLRVMPSRSTGGMTEFLGVISPPAGAWSVGIDCIVVELAPEHPRNPPLAIQWPGSVLHDGERFPRTED